MLKIVIIKIKRLFASCCEIGIYQTWLIIKCRIVRAYFMYRMRGKALKYASSYGWSRLAKLCFKDWDTIFGRLCGRQLPYIKTLFGDAQSEQLMSDANQYVQHFFQGLGSSWYQLDDTMWHTDIRLKQSGLGDTLFSSALFYADIEIVTGQDDRIQKDIKVPWELSRLQHLPLLGYMYQATNDHKYKDAFVMHVQHWREHNPYLLGINWLCPMEVALRSISLVIAFDSFKKADIDASFWQSYAGLLYDHMIYLEGNWEWYDGRTSNHYLSDLVGYLYLCFFFQSCWDVSKKLDWAIKEIIREMEKQIFKEGTSYEGSTRYHSLVTELFFHVQQLAGVMHITLPESFHETLSRMFEFIDWCSIDDKHMITIGDHDGGKVTYVGLPYKVISGGKRSTHIKHYNQFGLSIVKNNRWHVSLRHHAYHNKQPSGHYHNDVGSITVGIKGIPVLVDPGSYLYTSSKIIRNQFRSASVHNMIHIEGQELVPFDDRLFALAVPENRIDMSHNDKKILYTSHRLFEQYHIKYNRVIKVFENALFINDNIEKLDINNEDIYLFFNFNFDANVTLQKEFDYWVGYYGNKPLFKMQSSYDLQKVKGDTSPTYGVLVPMDRLISQVPCYATQTYVTSISVL